MVLKRRINIEEGIHKNIREKDQIQDTFLVSKKDAGMSRTGKPYLNLRLMDSTGGMEPRLG